MFPEDTPTGLSDRGIESIHSGLLLLGFSVLLSLFMAAVIFLNGSAG